MTSFSPVDSAIINTDTPILEVFNSHDAEEDSLVYAFEVHFRETMDSLAAIGEDIEEGDSTTSWNVNVTLDENRQFWWRSRAYDGYENGEWMEPSTFFVDAIQESPEAIDDLSIQLHSGAKSYGGNLFLSWSEPYDDFGVDYYVIYRSESTQELGDSLDMTTDTTYLDLYVYAIGKPNLHYYYTVRAVDYSGNKSQASNQVGEFDKVMRW